MELDIRNLTKTFGSTAALHGIDLKVASGELLALLGPLQDVLVGVAVENGDGGTGLMDLLRRIMAEVVLPEPPLGLAKLKISRIMSAVLFTQGVGS